MNEWNIQSRAHACQACGKGFADKEVYYTLLMELKHELQRHDICKECWDKERALPKDESKRIVSQWHGVYHRPPAAPPDAIQKETAETLLRKLIEANDPTHGPACFILAVMLERKRLLKVKEQFKREGIRVFVYEHPKSGDIFTITDPNLQLNQLDAVQRDVGELLAHGLPAPASEPAPAPATEPVAGDIANPVAEPNAQPVPPVDAVAAAPDDSTSTAAAPEGVSFSEAQSTEGLPTSAAPVESAESANEPAAPNEGGQSETQTQEPPPTP